MHFHWQFIGKKNSNPRQKKLNCGALTVTVTNITITNITVTTITVTTITVTVTVTVTVSAVQTSVCVCGQPLVTGAEACMRLLRVQHMVHWDESTLSLLWDQKKRLVCPKCHPISTTSLHVEYHSSVLRFLAAEVTWELSGRLRALGVPFPNWHVLLCRHQLGATWLTVGTEVSFCHLSFSIHLICLSCE